MKFSNGDRVEAHIKSIDRWRPATVLTTYPGHGGHMVITDGGQRLHAKRGDLRAIGEGERTITPDPHDTAYQGEVGDHQPHSDSIGALTPLELDALRLRPLPPLDGASIIPPMGPITASTLKYGYVAKTDELSMRTPENTPPIVPQGTMFKETMRRLGINTDERDGYFEAILEFAKAGISPDTVNSYVAALGRFSAYGFTPEDLERITTEKIRENIDGGPAHDTLPNITAEYRGTR